jgi:hypothetical protein
MYKELEKFKVSDKFSFAADDSLEQTCNAQKEGAFLVYAVAEEKS